MNNPIIYQVVGGLLILFFFYLTYMFTKTWRWPHVTIMFFVFAGVVCLTVFAAMSVRTHVTWKSRVVRNRAELERLTTEHQLLSEGRLTELVRSEPSYRELTSDLNRVLLDRGRVWRNVAPAGIADGNITVNMTATTEASASDSPAGTADPAAGESAPAAPANQLTPGLVLYLFQEVAPPPELNLPEGARVPVAYLGEFNVTAANEGSATLTPTMPLSPSQLEKVRAGGSWAMYETMPVDGHQYYSTEPYGNPDWSRPATEVGVFGEMDRDMLERIFQPHRAALGDRYDELIETYLKDGMQASSEEARDSLWAKVRFVAEHEVDVDSEALLDPVGGEEGFFEQGRTGLPMLKRGAAVNFKPNDIAVLPRRYVDDVLLPENKIDPETIEPIFTRPLHNYEARFVLMQQYMFQLARDIQQAQRDQQALTDANQKVLDQIALRETEEEKLEQDRSQVAGETEKLQELLARMEMARQEKRQDLSRVYRENLLLMNELRELETERNQRLEEAAPAANSTASVQ